jgi:hypothetical protein
VASIQIITKAMFGRSKYIKRRWYLPLLMGISGKREGGSGKDWGWMPDPSPFPLPARPFPLVRPFPLPARHFLGPLYVPLLPQFGHVTRIGNVLP